VAQEPEPDLSDKKQQDVEALKVAFISKELDLTPDEAQKFWPVYNQYSKELNGVVAGSKEDVLERDKNVLDVRIKYRDQFSKILGAPRMNRMYNAEGRFRHLLIKALRQQKMKRNMRNNNRPMLRQ
jgi:hypothetical protein